MNKKVCCVIVTYNCLDDFIKTFNSVYSQVDKVLIVDNGSNDNTIKLLKDLKNKNDCELILLYKNMGIATALNKGIEYAVDNNYEWLLTLDHDSILDRDMIDEMFKAYDSYSDKEKNTIVSLFPNYIEKKYKCNIKKERKTFYITGSITSGNLVKVKLFNKIGRYNEKLFIDYVDYDFCFRILKNNYKMIKCNSALLFHQLGDTKIRDFFGRKISYTNHSAIRRYYITRNRIYCWRKYRDIAREFIKNDKKCFINEWIKIIIFEDNKCLKIRMIIKGILDCYKNNFGEVIFFNKN